MTRFSFTLLLIVGLLACGSAQTDFSSQLPIIVVNTQGADIPDEPKLNARMGVIDNGPGRLNRPSDDFNEYDGYAGIELRGSSTLTFEKKGYGLETRFADGSDRQVGLLGFPVEEDWVLRGPYSDKSLMRDALAYKLASTFIPFTPRVRLVELIINDDYRGVYLFTEKIKRDKNRVDIKKMKPEYNEGDRLTGGYIIKIDKLTAEESGGNVFFESAYNAVSSTERTPRFIYHYPKPEDITEPQREYISSYVTDFEDALAGDDYQDPETGYRAYADVNSFIDYMLFSELTRNVDGYRISTYLYKDRDSEGGKLKMGPVWDYNLGFGNADYCNGGLASGWAFKFNSVCPEDGLLIPFWWERMMTDGRFVDQLKSRWSELRQGPLSNDRINGTIDSLLAEMGDAPARNFERWPVLSTYVWPNIFIGGSYPAEVDYLRGWISDRTRWLDGQIFNLTNVPVPQSTVMAPLPVYPNPTADWFLAVNEETGDLTDVRLINHTGQVVFETRRLGYGQRINLTDQPEGVYYLHGRRADGNLMAGRVVKQAK